MNPGQRHTRKHFAQMDHRFDIMRLDSMAPDSRASVAR